MAKQNASVRSGSEPSHNSLGLALSDADMAAIAGLDRGERLLTLNWGSSDPVRTSPRLTQG